MRTSSTIISTMLTSGTSVRTIVTSFIGFILMSWTGTSWGWVNSGGHVTSLTIGSVINTGFTFWMTFRTGSRGVLEISGWTVTSWFIDSETSTNNTVFSRGFTSETFRVTISTSVVWEFVFTINTRTMWGIVFSVSFTGDTIVNGVGTGFTSLWVTWFTNLTDFGVSMWTGTGWWIISSTSSTGKTVFTGGLTGSTLVVTLATITIIVTVKETSFTRTLGWELSSLVSTSGTTVSVFTSSTDVQTRDTGWVITIIIISIWTWAIVDWISDISTISTVRDSTGTFVTFIVTILTRSFDVGLS